MSGLHQEHARPHTLTSHVSPAVRPSGQRRITTRLASHGRRGSDHKASRRQSRHRSRAPSRDRRDPRSERGRHSPTGCAGSAERNSGSCEPDIAPVPDSWRRRLPHSMLPGPGLLAEAFSSLTPHGRVRRRRAGYPHDIENNVVTNCLVERCGVCLRLGYEGRRPHCLAGAVSLKIVHTVSSGQRTGNAS